MVKATGKAKSKKKGVGSVKDFSKSFFLRKEDRAPQWHLFDAEGAVLGRLSTQIATILRGKHKPEYTPHTDAGDYVVVINAAKVKLTGDKLKGKKYARYTGWMGGYKEMTAEELLAKHPTRLVEYAVKGMMPKDSALSRSMLRKLRVYADDKHGHQAQLSAKK